VSVFAEVAEKKLIRARLGILVKKTRLLRIIDSDPSQPFAVQKRALLAAISSAFHDFARTRLSVMTKYRQMIEVGL
jgi:hypothetical protein